VGIVDPFHGNRQSIGSSRHNPIDSLLAFFTQSLTEDTNNITGRLFGEVDISCQLSPWPKHVA
jgi:hypothetical protein